jgi:hypothetical protein
MGKQAARGKKEWVCLAAVSVLAWAAVAGA